MTAVGFLRRAVAHFAAFGIRVERLMTDNGSAYRATIHALACKTLGIKHLRTRPYRPRTNGKAERFIRTLLAGWAYGAIYHNSHERQRALAGWLDFYNRRRPHRSLGRQAPLERLITLNRNNVLGSYKVAGTRCTDRGRASVKSGDELCHLPLRARSLTNLMFARGCCFVGSVGGAVTGRARFSNRRTSPAPGLLPVLAVLGALVLVGGAGGQTSDLTDLRRDGANARSRQQRLGLQHTDLHRDRADVRQQRLGLRQRERRIASLA